MLETFFCFPALPDIAERINIAQSGAIHHQRRAMQAHIHQVARFIRAHRFHQRAPLLIYGLFKCCVFGEPSFRHNQFTQAPPPASSAVYPNICVNAGLV